MKRSSSVKSSSRFQRNKNIIDIEIIGSNKLIRSKYDALTKRY